MPVSLYMLELVRVVESETALGHYAVNDLLQCTRDMCSRELWFALAITEGYVLL